jgi:hypothetical protein
LFGCATIQANKDEIAKQKLVEYGCWWPCYNEAGETGWCCEHEVPEGYRWILKDCQYATQFMADYEGEMNGTTHDRTDDGDT